MSPVRTLRGFAVVQPLKHHGNANVSRLIRASPLAAKLLQPSGETHLFPKDRSHAGSDSCTSQLQGGCRDSECTLYGSEPGNNSRGDPRAPAKARVGSTDWFSIHFSLRTVSRSTSMGISPRPPILSPSKLHEYRMNAGEPVKKMICPSP